MLKRLVGLVFLLLMLVVLSCQASPASPPPGEPPSTSPEPVVPEGAQPLVALAKEDLSQRKGIPLSQIEVVQVEEVDWPNSSLGFPKPGMVYAQVIVPGYRIILSDGSQSYEYHTDRGQRIEYGD
jgi:hypothetical protein